MIDVYDKPGTQMSSVQSGLVRKMSVNDGSIIVLTGDRMLLIPGDTLGPTPLSAPRPIVIPACTPYRIKFAHHMGGWYATWGEMNFLAFRQCDPSTATS